MKETIKPDSQQVTENLLQQIADLSHENAVLKSVLKQISKTENAED